MVSGPNSRPAGTKCESGDMDRNLQQIRVLCGARSPNTIAKEQLVCYNFACGTKGIFTGDTLSRLSKTV